MKTLAKTMFALLILVANSLGMLGQKTLLIHNIRPLLAYPADIQNDIELSAELTASSYRFNMEEKVQLEDWMISQNEWKDESGSVPGNAVKVDPEPDLRTEGWMIQPFSAGSYEIWDFLVETIEEPLEIRKWMICCADWNLKTMQAGWMTSPVINIQ